MRASIISVGSEILRGSLLDTNSQYFAQELRALGATVVRIVQVPDDLDVIVGAISSSSDLSTIVVMSGGLGPTEDDLSREAVMQFTGESPTIDKSIVAEIRQRFTLRGEDMPIRNEKQAWRIPSALILDNPHGTAPGWFVHHNGVDIALLPGPPRENRPMWESLVVPKLRPLLSEQAIATRTIKTLGIGESAVADRLGDLIAAKEPEVATYAKQDGVHVTVTATAPTQSLADTNVQAVVELATSLLGPVVYGYGDDSLAAAVVQPLLISQERFSIWEAGTAGAFAHLLLSDVEARAVVADARAWPRLPDDATNAGDLATIAAHKAGSDVAIAIVVQDAETNGMVSDGVVELAIWNGGEIRTSTHRVRGSITEVCRRSALLAAECLWRAFREK